MPRPRGAAQPSGGSAPGLAEVSSLLSGLEDRARSRGVFLIARHQSIDSRRVVVINGVLEDVGVARTSGLGLQVFSRDGRSAFGSLDRVEAGAAEALLDGLMVALREATRRRHATNREVWSATPTSATVLRDPPFAIDRLPLKELVATLVELNRGIAALRAGMKVETSFGIRTEEWLIRRSDGTVSHFRMPRATCSSSMTIDALGGSPLSVSAGASAPSYELLLDSDRRAQLERRARRAVARMVGLIEAPYVTAGAYPLVIDYALAKGLAHEAFGHAAESDSYRSSCLAEKGRLRVGLKVASERVSIIDEPIWGDHAWQPIDANGVPRRRATIVRAGHLDEGLSDLFTARPGGVPLSGAARAESYRSIPLPRMSNIRIEMADPRPLPRPFEEMEPEDVRGMLRAAGLLDEGRVAYLSGYRGGQVNTMRGDFVFNCGAIHMLERDRIQTFRPAIFSGHFLSALAAVRAGFGPLLLDAIGTCGKWGQSVPSSGGSNAFLYLEPKPDVTIGGRV